jgi:DNA polymerase-3 subunit epsilon
MKIEPGYYGWMLDADFPLYTKKCLKNEMQRIKDQSYNEVSMKEKLNELKHKFNSK